MKEKYLDVIGEQEKITDYLSELLGISGDVIAFAFGIYGVNEETINNLIYYYSGYRDLWQFAEYEDPQEIYKDFGLDLFEEEEEE